MSNKAENEPAPILVSISSPDPEHAVAVTAPESHEFLVQGSESISSSVRMELLIEQRGEKVCLALHGSFATDNISCSRRNLFNTVTESYFIEYGLRGGTLRIKLNNATAPLGSRYNPPIAETFTSKRGYSEERSTSLGGKIGWSGWKLTGGLDLGARSSAGAEGSTEYCQASFTTFGVDTEPCWRVESGDPARHLAGRPPGFDPPLGELHPKGERIQATAVFAVRAADLIVRRIHPQRFEVPVGGKKLAVLARALPQLLARRAFSTSDGEILVARSSTHFDVAVPARPTGAH